MVNLHGETPAARAIRVPGAARVIGNQFIHVSACMSRVLRTDVRVKTRCSLTNC